MSLSHGDTFTLKGLTFRVEHAGDDTGIVPWKEYDGHGPVREVLGSRGNKRPGERVMGTRCRVTWLYDFQSAMLTARRDGWGLDADGRAALAKTLGRDPTPGEVTAQAVENDFMRLSRFVAGDWDYIGVIVTLLDLEGDATDETESLWAVESDAGAYLDEVARELAGEIAGRVGRRKYLMQRVRVRK